MEVNQIVLKNKKILITGITGMVGSHLTDYLLKIQNVRFMVFVVGGVLWKT